MFCDTSGGRWIQSLRHEPGLCGNTHMHTVCKTDQGVLGDQQVNKVKPSHLLYCVERLIYI